MALQLKLQTAGYTAIAYSIQTGRLLPFPLPITPSAIARLNFSLSTSAIYCLDCICHCIPCGTAVQQHANIDSANANARGYARRTLARRSHVPTPVMATYWRSLSYRALCIRS